MDKHQVIERYARAATEHDLETTARLLHPDVVVRYPQSGEIFRGRDNYLKMLSEYPTGLPEGQISAIKGEGTTALLPSTMPFASSTITVFGGDQFVIEGLARYADGKKFNTVFLLRLQGGLVIEESDYFAEPFDAPEWRRPFVDQSK
ncbi:MAG: nuclear transport factor 2 family protein [Acidimicrobiia bacterium]